MNPKMILPSRRQLLKGAVIGAGALALPAMLWTPGVFAEELTLTPSMGAGPFYPDRLPLDTDNDLLVITDSITPAVGEVTHLSGRILSKSGEPVRNALVELWQVDSHGSYLHSKGANPKNGSLRDGNFQGYGRFLTNQKGEYYFRTIKPVAYPGRTPHVHFAVSHNNKRILGTQMLIKDEPANQQDDVFRQISDEKLRNLLLAEFKPLEKSKIGELTASFDMIIGYTPED